MCVLWRVYTNKQITTALAQHENTFYMAKIDFKFPLFFSIFRMPKAGLDASEWERRLWLFAEGKFEFGRGHAPLSGSVWAKKRSNILKCPVGKARIDVFGKTVSCTCGYHQGRTLGVCDTFPNNWESVKKVGPKLSIRHFFGPDRPVKICNIRVER